MIWCMRRRQNERQLISGAGGLLNHVEMVYRPSERAERNGIGQSPCPRDTIRCSRCCISI